MKDLVTKITESKSRFYPEDYKNISDVDTLTEAILDALQYTGLYDVVCESINNDKFDPHEITNGEFGENFANKLSEAISEYFNENY